MSDYNFTTDEGNSVQLLQGDCLERMKEIPKGKVKLILTDPPYEMVHQKSLKRLKSGMLRGGDRLFQEELKSTGITLGFSILPFLDKCLTLFEKKQQFCGMFMCSKAQLSKYLVWAETNKFQYGVGVWHKSNPAPLCNCKYLNDVEYWVYIKGNKSKILGSYASKSMVYHSKVNKADKDLFGHPTPKPIELMEKFVINHSSVGDVVFDPFFGSGSAIKAANNLNRNSIGIEMGKCEKKNHKYFGMEWTDVVYDQLTNKE